MIAYFTKDKLPTVSASILLYDMAYVLWISTMVLNTSLYARYIAVFYNGIRYVSLGLLVLSELSNVSFSTHTTSNSVRYAIGILISVLILIGIFTSHDMLVFDGFVFLICSRDKDFRHLATISYRLLALLLPLIAFSSLIGVVPNYTAWSGGRIRSFLGFRYALFPAQYGYLIVCLLCHLKGKQLALRHLVAIVLSNYFIYYHTTSRLSFAFAVILPCICATFNLTRKGFRQKQTSGVLKRLFLLFSALAFPASAVFSIALSYFYDSNNEWMRALDGVDLLGGRLAIGRNALLAYPLRLFGREMHFSGAALNPLGESGDTTTYDTIDCLYVRILLCFGVIFTVLFVVLFSVATVRALREGNVHLVLVLVSIALHSIIDNLTLYLHYNTFLLLMGMLMSNPAVKYRGNTYE